NVGLVEAGDAFAQVKTNLTPQTSYDLNIGYTIDGQESQDIRLIVSQQDPNNLNIQFNPGPMKGFPERMRRGAIYLGLRMRGDPDDALRFSRLDIEKRSQQILDFLKVLEPNLRELSAISLPQQRPMMYADIGMERKIPVALVGEGMSRLLSIILAI